MRGRVMITQSGEQVFNLNVVNIKCSFQYRWSYYPELKHMVSHLEFRSLMIGKPNDISETGYLSEFIMNQQHEAFEDIKDMIKQYIESRNIKVLNLDFKIKKEIEQYEQLELFAGVL